MVGCMYNFENLWLPYSGVLSPIDAVKVVSGSGCYLELENGKKLLDGISSWWSVCHGYSHPHIVAKMREQVERLSHVMLCSGLVHEGACELASRLMGLAPPGLQKVFFSDSGSMAVEVAMKIAVQYWHIVGKPQKTGFVAFKNAYHGDSMGCMSVSDPMAIHGPWFSGYYPAQHLFDLPVDERDFELLRRKIEQIAHEAAAIIVEPILQAAGGMRIYPPEVLASLLKLAREANILFIVDEVATGFGRIGTMFACEQAQISPDIMVLGKAMTGGMCPLSATLVSSEICGPFESCGERLMHGNTFAANPLACAAANASLDLFEDGSLMSRVQVIEERMGRGLEPLRGLKYVHNIRVKGAVAAMEIAADNFDHLQENFLRKLIDCEIWIRPIGNTVYLMPPLIISDAELEHLLTAVCTLVHSCRERLELVV
ncbi:adenosylmethionine--8-amino-7-oxononanoate transaminase [Anaplasma marginale]|uniref:adenosylmethionine--8-amino-7-oxononanoate transaminase n=1 Tax=Anaplasma marginale TaxID=770 RepID=UPI0002E1EEF9|nr:adenosylmethionine--8-amino-7-oxononanoate transaminase [Anaplasma marginale]